MYVKIAECFLAEDMISESDSAVTKAGGVVESISSPEEHMALILRYKSTYARVLDSNRKFLQAAQRYHDLSQSNTEAIDADDLLVMLGRAATCAILAPSGPQRHRVLGLVRVELRFVLSVSKSFERTTLQHVYSILTRLFFLLCSLFRIYNNRSTKTNDCLNWTAFKIFLLIRLFWYVICPNCHMGCCPCQLIFSTLRLASLFFSSGKNVYTSNLTKRRIEKI